MTDLKTRIEQALPADMLAAPRWLVWRYKPQDGRKPRKVPHYADGSPRRGTLDSPADTARLASFTNAARAFESGGYAGFGFALGPDGTGRFWQGIDIDDLDNHPELSAVAEALPGYVEHSPSGKGLHALGRGRGFAPLAANDSGVEAYSSGRFFTVTGQSAGFGWNEVTVDIAEFVENELRPRHGSVRKVRPMDPDEKFLSYRPQIATENMTPEQRVQHAAMQDFAAWVPELFPAARPYQGGYRVASKDLGRPLEEDLAIHPAGIRDFGEEVGLTPLQVVEQWRGKDGALEWLAERVGVDLEHAAESDPIERLTPVDLADKAPLAPVEFAVEPIMPRGLVTLLGGHGGSGKSYLALTIACHIAAGVEFARCPTASGRVLFVSLEDSGAIVRFRMQKICELYFLDQEVVRENLMVLDGTETMGALASETRLAGVDALRGTPLLQQVAAASEGTTAVVIDNASDAFSANENDRNLVRAFMRRYLGRIARDHRTAVLLLAHIDKVAARYGAAGNSFSGSTAWHNSARSRLALLPDPKIDNQLSLIHEKANHGARAAPLLLTRAAGGVPVPVAAPAGGPFNAQGAATFITPDDDGDAPDQRAALHAKRLEEYEAARAADAAAALELQRQQDEAVLDLLRTADKDGEILSTARTGPNNLASAMRKLPEFPAWLTTEKFWHSITRLARAGALQVLEYSDDRRKRKKRYALADESAPVSETAEVETTESAQAAPVPETAESAPVRLRQCISPPL